MSTSQDAALIRPEQKPGVFSFRIATGLTAPKLFSLLRRHRFRVSPSRLGPLLGAVATSLVTIWPARGQRRRYGAELDAIELPPPVFVVGHWRSGTTFLHELLATDPRFLTPTYLHTFAADYCIRWASVLRRLERFLPQKRPMDDIDAGWDRPQEDEFGLLSVGARSPYEIMLFPNDRGDRLGFLDVEAMQEDERRLWEESLVEIMRRVVLALRNDGRTESDPSWLLLKSPTHTARIGTLARMFPDARFIHVTRNPLSVYKSTEHLWRRMFETQGLQRPRYDGQLALPGFINNTMRALYRRFDDDVAALPHGRFAETRYEDLVRDPVGEIARLRSEIGLPPAEGDGLARYLGEVSGHRRNRFDMDAATVEMVRREWDWYFDRFGYDPESPL